MTTSHLQPLARRTTVTALAARTVDRIVADHIAAKLPRLPGAAELQAACNWLPTTVWHHQPCTSPRPATP